MDFDIAIVLIEYKFTVKYVLQSLIDYKLQ